MKKLLLSIITIFVAFILIATPVYAEERCTLTSVLGNSKCSVDEEGNVTKGGDLNCSCDSGNGNSIIHILVLIMDIMTIGIGILGVIGISVVGVQYLTAGGNEEQTRKAKRRLYEIIIGLAAYVLIYALLKWLLPGFEIPEDTGAVLIPNQLIIAFTKII